MSLRLRYVSALFVAYGVASGCASASSGGDALPGHQNLDDGGRHYSIVDAAFHDVLSLDSGLNPMCGIAGFCYRNGPDDPLACAVDDASVGYLDATTGRSHDAGRSDASGKALDAGDGAPSPVDDASVDAGDASSDTALDSGSAPDGRVAPPPSLPDPGTPGAPGTEAPPGVPSSAGVDAGPRLACQVGPDDTYGKPVHSCKPAGTGGVKSPCASSSDCRAGLACVGERTPTTSASDGGEAAGQCLPYCCDPRTQCEAGSFCVEKPLVATDARIVLHVPVCAPAEVCTPLQPFPCFGTDCCPADSACTVVNNEGLTGCVKPGKNTTGQPCPCAANYYCSQATNTCVKMCKTTESQSACAPGKCQAAATFPTYFGLCVGQEPALK